MDREAPGMPCHGVKSQTQLVTRLNSVELNANTFQSPVGKKAIRQLGRRKL